MKDKLVYGENIAQTAQFVESGSADIGIIALSLAVAPPMKAQGRYWQVPPRCIPSIAARRDNFVMGKISPAAARQFRNFVLSREGKEILRNYGFNLPDN